MNSNGILRERILFAAATTLTPAQFKGLRQDDAFSSPSTFFRNALDFGLITEDEYTAARRAGGDLWNYTGD